MFVERVRHAIGALATNLGGLDALVFTDRAGVDSAALRAAVCDGLGVSGTSPRPEPQHCTGARCGRGQRRVTRPDSGVTNAGRMDGGSGSEAGVRPKIKSVSVSGSIVDRVPSFSICLLQVPPPATPFPRLPALVHSTVQQATNNLRRHVGCHPELSVAAICPPGARPAFAPP
jgi:hypothetical protein